MGGPGSFLLQIQWVEEGNIRSLAIGHELMQHTEAPLFGSRVLRPGGESKKVQG
jgi:hypothetical protein